MLVESAADDTVVPTEEDLVLGSLDQIWMQRLRRQTAVLLQVLIVLLLPILQFPLLPILLVQPILVLQLLLLVDSHLPQGV